MTSFLFSKTGVLIFVIIAFLAWDIKKHGSYRASKTGTFLRKLGAQQYGEGLFKKFRMYSQQVYRWSLKNVPEYTASARANLIPFLITLKDLVFAVAVQLWANLKLLGQYLMRMKMAVVKMVDSYAPGLPAQLGDCLCRAWSSLTEVSVKVAKLILQYLSLGARWLRDNVFIGRLSPENLQRYALEAFNTIHSLTTKSITWLNSKIAAVGTAS